MANRCKYALCTLFNSVYADKGIVLYESLKQVAKEFTLYVLAMDEKCYEIISDLKCDSLIPISLSDFETKELLVAKSNRPLGEYCWTCASSLIKYVLEKFNTDYCIYIDADMAFYHDPYILIDELEKRGADVSFVSHRFKSYDKEREHLVGHFCVECNTFKNTDNSRKILDNWIALCLEDCSIKSDGEHWGDQKYLEFLYKRYDGIIESELLGAGVAPWNICQYKKITTNDIDGYLIKPVKGRMVPLVFYHFERIMSTNNGAYNINVFSSWGINKDLVLALYIPYLQNIAKVKEILMNRYNVDTTLYSHPALIPVCKESFLQKLIRVFKMVLSLDLVQWFWHTLPTHIYGKNNILKV